MHDLFNLNDALIRGLPNYRHVEVTRIAPRNGERCQFRKVFQADGLRHADYWMSRENDFLLDFTLKKLHHTVELANFCQKSDGYHTPIIASVDTYDAGLTIEDWLRIPPQYANGITLEHPFQHAGQFLLLLRACLEALKEIHSHHIIHCDIKPDNICLPYRPYPYSCQTGQTLHIDFAHLRLIDFSFSITSSRPLEHPLPIEPTAPYQARALKTALAKDAGQHDSSKLTAQKLTYAVDLFALGYLAKNLFNTRLDLKYSANQKQLLKEIDKLVQTLLDYDKVMPNFSVKLPHDKLIAEINALLKKIPDVDDYRDFTLSLENKTEPAITPEPTPVNSATPATDAVIIKNPFNVMRAIKAVVGILAITASLFYIYLYFGSSSVIDPPKLRSCSNYSDQNKDYANCQFNPYVKFSSQDNPEQANFKDAVGKNFPDWIKKGLNEAGVYNQTTLIEQIRKGHKNLKGANLKSANLQNLSLRNADLSESDLQDARLNGADIHGVNWEHADLTRATWTDGRRCGPGSIGVCN